MGLVAGAGPRRRSAAFQANASGLAWLDERRLLFAEIMSGVHMGIVTATERGPLAGDLLSAR